MSLPTAKKTATASSSPSERVEKQLRLDSIKQMRQLEDGYFLLKIQDAGKTRSKNPSVSALNLSVPEIPVQEVRRLLKKYVQSPQSPDDARRTGRRSSPEPESIPPENQAFMDEVDAQAMVARERHLREGHLMTADAFRQALGITRQAVSKAVEQQRMFSLDGPAGRLVYPGFFTESRYDRRTLERVSQALGELPGPSKWQFFTTGKASLHGQTPLEAIANGQIANVLVTAAGFKER